MNNHMLIEDYRPPQRLRSGQSHPKTSDGDGSEESTISDEYLMDVESWGQPGQDLQTNMRNSLWPITFDYFREGKDPFSWDHLGRARGIQFRPEKILSQPIAKLWKIRLDQISINPQNEREVAAFLLDGTLPSKPLRGGIIAGGRDYLVIISEPNRRGEPGRLYILR